MWINIINFVPSNQVAFEIEFISLSLTIDVVSGCSHYEAKH
jgi:hypothetical protein